MRHDDGLGLIRGLMWAIPIGLILWYLLIMAFRLGVM